MLSEFDRETWRTLWRSLAVRRGWQLVGDEDAFLDQAMKEYQNLAQTKPGTNLINLALLRIYSMLLCAGFVARRERAASEMWQTCYRLSRYRNIDEHDAADIAQEMIAQILVKLKQLRSPAAFMMWSLRIQRTAEKDLRKQQGSDPTLALDADTSANLPDLRDAFRDTETAIVNGELVRRMRQILNEREFVILARWSILGDKPGQIADELNMQPTAVRVIKSRAVKKLTDNADFIAFLRDLAETEPPPNGGEDEPTN
jgi:RNA polymerase sigma factor (sigma-70 family)